MRGAWHIIASFSAVFAVNTEARAQTFGDAVSGLGTAVDASSLMSKTPDIRDARAKLGSSIGIIGDGIEVYEARNQGDLKLSKALAHFGTGLLITGALTGAPAIAAGVFVKIGVEHLYDTYLIDTPYDDYKRFLATNENNQRSASDERDAKRINDLRNYLASLPQSASTARYERYGGKDFQAGHWKADDVQSPLNTVECGTMEHYSRVGGSGCGTEEEPPQTAEAEGFNGVWRQASAGQNGMLLQVTDDKFSLRLGQGMESCGTIKGTFSLMTTDEITGSFKGQCADLNMQGQVGMQRSEGDYTLTNCVSMATGKPDSCRLGYFSRAERAGSGDMR